MAMLHRDSVLRSSLSRTLVLTTLVGGVWGCKGSSTPPAPTSEASPAATEAKPSEPVMGKLDEKNFSLEMKSAGPYKAGAQGFVEVVLEPKGEFHCNQEYPYKIKLGTAPAGITYPQAVVKNDAITVKPEKAVMKVPFTADKPGESKVSGNFFFSVCTSQQCVIDNRELAVMVKVD
jgi:hypothetical protein